MQRILNFLDSSQRSARLDLGGEVLDEVGLAFENVSYIIQSGD